MSFVLVYLFVTSLFATGIGMRRLLTGQMKRWTVLHTVGLMFGSLFWPYMVWGAVCSATLDALAWVNSLIWKIYDRVNR